MKCPTCYLTEGPLGFALILLAAIVVIRSVAGGGVAPTPPMFDHSVTFDAALAESDDTGKPVFAFVTADWCAPCQTFKRGALAEPRVVEQVSSQTVPVYIDADQHPELVQQLGVQGFPTVLILRDGRIIDARSGVMGAAGLLAWLDGTLTPG